MEVFKRHVAVPPGTWFSGGFGSNGLTDGPDGLKVLFQPKPYYDPVIA